jgi:hypothetical protein
MITMRKNPKAFFIDEAIHPNFTFGGLGELKK